MTATRAEVLDYFRAKAARYDEVETQLYWRLSDEILWDALARVCRDALSGAPRCLDAGGGTARWSVRLCEAFPQARATVLDLSPDMLAVAAAKIEARGLGARMDCVGGDIAELPAAVGGERFDLVLAFHNVLGFVPDAGELFRRLDSVLAPGGHALVVAPNRFHGAYFNVLRGRLDEAERILADGRGRFADDMPAIAFFTADELRAAAVGAGWEPVVVTGFPRLLYPGVGETRLAGSSADLERLLSAEHDFATVLRLELASQALGPAPDRGNNLLLHAKARARDEG